MAGVDEEWFRHKDYYKFVDDYIDSAPADANEAVTKPRYHGATKPSPYLNPETFTASAGGYKINNLMTKEIHSSDPECKR